MYRLAFLLVLVLVGALPAHAQNLPGSEPLVVNISPDYPRPYDTISISPSSTLIDLSASTVTISVDGKRVYSGSGTTGIQARAGGLGTSMNISVAVTDSTGRTYTVQKVVRPAEVSLIAEPNSTVHLLYQGGKLVASEGKVRFIALPDLRPTPGTQLSASSLVYTWKVGDQLLTNASGIGKSTLDATAPVRYRNALVSVTVTNPDSSLVGQATTLIAATDPITRIYRDDPLSGPDFDTALSGTFSMNDAESTFRAVGYFFGASPTFAWTVNSSESGADKNITVRATGNGQGTAQIGLSTDDRTHYQSANTNVLVRFGANRSSFFGL